MHVDCGLPRKENKQHVNIHFICTSDSVTPLEMAEPIARELATLENEVFEVFDAYSNENALVVAPLLLVIYKEKVIALKFVLLLTPIPTCVI